MRNLLIKAAFAVALLSSPLMADSYNVTTSNGSGCSQNENMNSKFSFGSEFNTDSQQGSVMAKITIGLGKKAKKIDCGKLYNISVLREQLALDKARLEVEMLKAQIEQLKKGTKVSEVSLNSNDDW